MQFVCGATCQFRGQKCNAALKLCHNYGQMLSDLIASKKASQVISKSNLDSGLGLIKPSVPFQLFRSEFSVSPFLPLPSNKRHCHENIYPLPPIQFIFVCIVTRATESSTSGA